MRWQLGVNGAPVPHSPLDSHTSPGNAASQFHATSRLVGDGHLSGGTSRRQMPQDNPASQVPHAGGEGGGAVASLKARAFAMRQEVMRRGAVGDIPERSGRCRRVTGAGAATAVLRGVTTTTPRYTASYTSRPNNCISPPNVRSDFRYFARRSRSFRLPGRWACSRAAERRANRQRHAQRVSIQVKVVS